MGQHFLFLAVNSLPTDALRVIAAECQLWEHDTDMQSEQEKKEKEKLSSFICINKHFPIVARQTFNHRSSPNDQKHALLIKPALFIIRHLTGTLQYNNTLLLHNSCMVSLPLTSPSNYA